MMHRDSLRFAVRLAAWIFLDPLFAFLVVGLILAVFASLPPESPP